MFNPLSFFATGKDKPTISDADKVDSLYKRNRLFIMTAITFGYGSYYTCRLGLSVVKKPLMDSGILTAEQLGIIGSMILYGYAFGKLTNGFLADHSNVKRLFSFGLFCSAVINILMGSTCIFWIMALLWGLNGWFQAFGAPSSMVSMVNWFSNHERGRYYGIWSGSHSIGEGITFLVTASLVSIWGWKFGFWMPGVFCIIVAFLVFLLLKDRPQTLGLPPIADWKNDHGVKVKVDEEKADKTFAIQLQIFKYPALWILALASAFMYVTRYAIDSWSILYLQEARGCSLVQAGGILGANTIAGISGGIVYGFVSDKLFNARRPPVNLIFGIVQVLMLLVIFVFPVESKILLGISFVVYGFVFSGLLVGVGGVFPVDIMPKRAAGAVGGVMGVLSYLAAGTQERITGYLIDQGTTVVDGVKVINFDKAIVFWIGASIVSMLLAATLWRVKPSD